MLAPLKPKCQDYATVPNPLILGVFGFLPLETDCSAAAVPALAQATLIIFLNLGIPTDAYAARAHHIGILSGD